MPPTAVRPGTTLADRYRLEENLGTRGPTSAWRATDGLLQRPLLVHLVPQDAPGAGALLEAARAAALVTDSRFLRVLDASRSEGHVYVASEWVHGTDLAALVADGPLPAAEAGRISAEVAEGLAAAHAAGLAHLRLGPRNVLRVDNGQVKIVGLAVEAALAAGAGPVVRSDEATAREDACSCGAVLYAALTGRWPGPGGDGLPPAPEIDGAPCAPRQVRAGVAPELDDVACRALGLGKHAADRYASPAEVADALRATALPAAGWPAGPAPSVRTALEDSSPRVLAAPSRPGAVSRLARVSAATVVAAGVALGGWQLGLAAQDRNSELPPTPSARPGSSVTTPEAPSGEVLRVAAVTSFDPQGDDGEENDDRLEAAIDGKPGTAWQTSTYLQQFGPGGLKRGVGLVLDLGEVRPVSTVTLELEGRGTGVELATAGAPPTRPADALTVARSPDSGPLVTLRPEVDVSTRYLVVWLTALPQLGPEAFRAGITEITVRG
jgi:hypothetical protein